MATTARYKVDVELGSSRQESVYRDGSNDKDADCLSGKMSHMEARCFFVCRRSVMPVKALNER